MAGFVFPTELGQIYISFLFFLIGKFKFGDIYQRYDPKSVYLRKSPGMLPAFLRAQLHNER